MQCLSPQSKFSRCGLFIVFLALSPVFGQAPTLQVQCDQPALKRTTVMLAKQPDGLHKAALSNCGVYIDSYGFPWNRAGSLNELVRGSAFIFLGVVRYGRSELTNRGRNITTRYTVNVQQSLKGNLLPQGDLDFVIPGGKINFYDGSAAEVRSKEPALEIGHEYLFFADGPSGYGSGKMELRTTSIGQSIFEFAPDGHSVHPHVTQTDDPLLVTSQWTQSQLLNEVKIAMKNAASDAK
jgi:hypothetical protein